MKKASYSAPNRSPATRRKKGSCLRTLYLGALILPLIFGLTFCGLVVTSQAMLGTSMPSVQEAVGTFMVEEGMLPSSASLSGFEATAAPITDDSSIVPNDPEPTEDEPTPIVLPPTSLATVTRLPSETPTITTTASETESPTPGATLTQTPTVSPTPSPSHTATASTTLSKTPTRTPTASRTPTRTPLPTATHTSAPPSPTNTSGPTSPPPTATPSATTGPTATPSGCVTSTNASYESQLVGLINDERQAQGLPAYSVDSRLAAAARLHAEDMACNDFFSHTGSDGSRVGDRVARQGYSWSWVGENIFATSSTSDPAQSAFDWWMASDEGHRDNILHTQFTQVGIGHIYGADSRYGNYFVAVFARP